MFLGVLVVQSLSAQGVAQRASAEDLLDADFIRRASPVLETVVWSFPGRDEAALSYRRYGQLDLRVQFPLPSGSACGISIWHIPGGTPSSYHQLLAMREKSPGISVEEAVRGLKVGKVVRTIPCSSSLAGLLERGRELEISVADPKIPRYAVLFDSAETTLDLKMGNIWMTVDFPSSVDYPLARWADDVGEAVEAYIGRGFEAP